jgi:protein O-GlcNAc transferase
MNLEAARAIRSSGKVDDAIAAYWEVIASDPGLVPAHVELATCLREAGRHAEALAAVQQAVRLQPGDAGLRLALGGCFKSLGKIEEAAAECRRAIELQPTLIYPYNNLAACLYEMGRLSEVEQVFREALRHLPMQPDVHSNLAWCLYLQGRLPESIAEYRKTIALAPAWMEAHSRLLFVMLHDSTCSAREVFSEHLMWARTFADPLTSAAPPHGNSRDPDRRLRVGYISTDFRDNSMMFFIEPLLANHDHANFEITCYADAPDADEITARTKSYADRWRDIAGLSDEQIARQVRDDQIDVLVELSGHNGSHLLRVMGRKPAPVQVSNQGYAHSTGVRAIDYRIVDQYSDPPGMTDAFYSEKIIRLPRSNWVYRPPADAPQVAAAPCIANGYITFGSFNVLPKITPQVVELWSRVLSAAPDSRLVLKSAGFTDPPTRDRYLELFVSHGISASRLMFLDRTPARADHLAQYGLMDIALDPFPYNGTTTTCEALWMGVPTIVLAGRTHAARVGVSLLTNVGLPELVAAKPDDYVRITTELANDRPRLTELRATLRERMEHSPLRDEQGFAREMESQYRVMWRTWCAQA